MKKDFSQELIDLNGKPLINGKIPLTMKNVIVDAVLAPFPDEPEVTGTEKLIRWNLAQKVFLSSEQDYTDTEIETIKMLVGKYAIALIVGRIHDYISIKPETKNKKNGK